MSNLTILLDMDEVLCDFVGGACRIHGWTRADLETVWPIDTWAIVEPMGLTVGEFWAPIHKAGEAFWFDLEPTPWLDKLVTLIQSLVGDNWHVVTTPSFHPSSYSGKVRWIHKVLGKSFHRIVPTHDKTLLATLNSLLIDDKEETVTDFVAAGGGRAYGMVFPSRHNSLYRHAEDPVTYLTPLLKEQTDALLLSERQRCLPATRYGLQG